MQPDLCLIECPSIALAMESDLVPVPGLDVLHHEVDTLGIADVRQIKNLAYTSAFDQAERTIVIGATQLTTEAQNALLKLFEEVPTRTKIALVIPHASLLLPTVRSRFVHVVSAEVSNSVQLANEFLQMSYKARLELIAEKLKSKDLSWIEGIVPAVTKVLSGHTSYCEVLKTLALIDTYLRNRGASRKMLLEELALSLPVVET